MPERQPRGEAMARLGLMARRLGAATWGLRPFIEGIARRLGAGRELPLAPGERRLAVPAEGRAHRGHAAEAAAERHLRAQGYRIVCRRRANGRGELDLVALQGDTVVFVEVRSRSAAAPVAARDSLTATKRHRLTQCVELFVRQHGLGGRPRRIDLIAVTFEPGSARPRLEHLPGAVGAPRHVPHP